MTKQELMDMAAKLQEQANSMPDVANKDAPTTEETDAGQETSSGESKEKDNTPENEMNNEPEVNENDEVEEGKGIEPQTNGKITDDIKTGVKSEFEEPANGTETLGVEGVLSANLDQRFATLTASYQELAAEMDKMKVALSEILTRIELVQEVTDKVTTVDHDTLLSESIKLLI